ncbi:MAG: protein SCO1/2 [Gammaproteobacteria bacterium]|jgi:protein SCO1/2
MPIQARLPLLAAISFVAVIALGVGYFLGYTTQRSGLPEVSSVVWPPLLPLSPFTLTDSNGATFDETRLANKWTLLFFGFTHCPDICPTTLATLKQVREALLPVDEFAEIGQVVFVSVDGERDTPERLREYTDYFDPNFVAASGPSEKLNLLTRQFGMQVVRVSTDDPADYWFDHPASVLLVRPDTRVAGEFLPPFDVSEMVVQTRAIIEYGVP